MDPWALMAVILALVAAVVAAVAARNGQALERIRRALDAAPSEDVAAAVLRLRQAHDARARELAASRDTTSRFLDVVGPGVLSIDRELRVVEANPVAHALLGRQPGALLGRTVMEAFLDRTVEATARAALDTGAAATEIRQAGPDGPALAVRARRAPTGGVWLILDDVSELRRLQRIRTEFIDNLSHELRTPLTTVSLLAETLSMEASAGTTAIPDRMRDRIAKIEVETGHLVQMVNELLDLSRIEGGGTLQLVDGLDAGHLARDATERLRLFADRQSVDLRIETAPDLPPIRGDGPRLGQVVVNLVHNAVKFSPDGGVVTVRAASRAGEVVISVEDHGLGIPRAAQDRIFERFYKVDRARQREGSGGGTGLGLAIARHVVEQHGGRISVESQEGVGSTFHISLPVASPQPT
jgi:two-component system phosphate regulon sensor histidine kinase PhoR